MELLLILLGFTALVFGGEWLVRGAVSIASRLGISPMVIGLTLVGFGTSTPELLTSVQAALAGSPGVAVGNVVGSNTANTLLILGTGALMAPVVVNRAAFWRDGMALVATTALCTALVMVGYIGRLTGIVLVGLLLAYVVTTLVLERRAQSAASDVYAAEAAEVEVAGSTMPRALMLFVAGLLLTIMGARALVVGAISLATSIGVSEAVIGLTIVAIGTSLPELVTTVIAARKGHGDVAFGNVLGSNLFNLLGILGVTAIVSPLSIPAEIASFDIWVMSAATGAMVAMAITGWRIGRAEGAVLLGSYFAYLAWLVFKVL